MRGDSYARRSWNRGATRPEHLALWATPPC
ncbi:hypothetical protein A2U01_0089330, partial [Trifolium medium]|nr:hypothetical protein [Trifolium medium]